MVLIDGKPLRASELASLKKAGGLLSAPSQLNMEAAVSEILGAHERQSQKEHQKLSKSEAHSRYEELLWEDKEEKTKLLRDHVNPNIRHIPLIETKPTKHPEVKDIESAVSKEEA